MQSIWQTYREAYYQPPFVKRVFMQWHAFIEHHFHITWDRHKYTHMNHATDSVTASSLYQKVIFYNRKDPRSQVSISK